MREDYCTRGLINGSVQKPLLHYYGRLLPHEGWCMLASRNVNTLFAPALQKALHICFTILSLSLKFQCYEAILCHVPGLANARQTILKFVPLMHRGYREYSWSSSEDSRVGGGGGGHLSTVCFSVAQLLYMKCCEASEKIVPIKTKDERITTARVYLEL